MLYSYMPNFEKATKFLEDWWLGKEMERPVIFISSVRVTDPELLLPVPQVEGVFCPTKTFKSAEYRLAYENNKLAQMNYHAEGMAIAHVTGCAQSFAAYMGGTATENEDTVWVHPWFRNIQDVKVTFNEDNPYWQYHLKSLRLLTEFGRDKFVVVSPPVLDGLDILSTMLGPEQLLYDIMDYPELVMEKNIAVTDLYLELYDRIFKIIRDKTGGSVYLFWSKGKMFRGQCDFSAMLSPQLFRDLAVPQLRRTFKQMAHSIYHWDGPGALCHLDALLEIKELDVLQYVPGAGNPPNTDKCWWKMYHKILDAGKKIQIHPKSDIDAVLPMKKEFGRDFTRFMVTFGQPFKTEKETVDVINRLAL